MKKLGSVVTIVIVALLVACEQPLEVSPPELFTGLVGTVTPAQPAVVWLEGGGHEGDLRPIEDVTVNCELAFGEEVSEQEKHYANMWIAQVLDQITYVNCPVDFKWATYIEETVIPLGLDWNSPILKVVASRFYTVADLDGNFLIRDVPPGIYMIHAWSQTAGHVQRGIVVPLVGAQAAGTETIEVPVFADKTGEQIGTRLDPRGLVDFFFDRSYVMATDPTGGPPYAIAPIR